MKPEEIQKLLGGYATGSLTAEERRALFAAALEDQELFNALEDEQALKELLDHPESREQVRLAAVAGLPEERREWLRWPRRWWVVGASTALAATAALTIAFLAPWNRPANKLAAVLVTQHPVTPSVPEQAPVQPQPVRAKRAPKALAEHRRLAERPQFRVESGKSDQRTQEVAALETPQPAPAAVKEQPAGRFTRTGGPYLAGGVPPRSPTDQAEVAPAAPPAPKPQRFATPQAFGVEMAKKTADNAPRGVAAGSPVMLTSASLDQPIGYSLARQSGDSWVAAPAGASFQPGEQVRLTLVPTVSGRLTIEEQDAAAPGWKLVYPPRDEALEVRPYQNYVVPTPISVKTNQRLRVNVGSKTVVITIRSARP